MPRRLVAKLIEGSYRVLYQVSSETVEILAVVHGSRDLTTGLPPWDRPK